MRGININHPNDKKITFRTCIYFKPWELLVITLAAVAGFIGAFITGRCVGIDAAIKSASYYSDGVDERGAFYELEFLNGRVDRYYWKEEQ